jgi:hypothetical protein
MSHVSLEVKANAVLKAAKLAFNRFIAKNPRKARVLAWLFIDERRMIKGVSHRQAKKTKAATGGFWICIHRYPMLGDQLFARVTAAERGKRPIKPGEIDPVALSDTMLPPELDEWSARFAGPLGEWPAVEGWIKQSVATLGTLVKADNDWLRIDAQLPM